MPTQPTTKTEPEGKVNAWLLFAGFFHIGAFTIGGGYAMIPIIQRDLVKREWFEEEEFLDLIAVAQSIPGAIAVNAAILVGYRLGGIIGALAATLGAVLPSFLVILLVASLLVKFWEYPYISGFLAGARPAVVGLLLYAALSLGKKAVGSVFDWVSLVSGFVALVVFNVHPIAVIVLAGLAGFVRHGKGR
ncbi:chromate transporter [Metallumcola ferriviriculae]|uniref:Chromate transporter n=1 Tax=Metallumcola ferriviriculae TaxID=3039180 RepID=A0AAU0UJ50_9FIRM|nr:chromate transporter [Desulfitibacteraceae bacterium MK1]